MSHDQMDVRDLMSGMCPDKYKYVPRSDVRIGNGGQKQEVGFVIVDGGIVNKEIHMNASGSNRGNRFRVLSGSVNLSR